MKKKSKSTSNGCPKGQIKRKSYKKKSGTTVSAKCIKATSQSGEKRTDVDKRILKEKAKVHMQMREKYGSKKCKTGEVMREGYRRKSRSKTGSQPRNHQSRNIEVKPTCIKSKTGKPHGEQLFVLEKDILKKYGYHNVKDLSKVQRHTALKKALKKIKPLSLMRRLNALAVLNKDQNPRLSKIFKSDSEWIKTTDEYKNRNK